MSWRPQWYMIRLACLHGAGHLRICSRWALPLLGLSWGPFPHRPGLKASEDQTAKQFPFAQPLLSRLPQNFMMGRDSCVLYMGFVDVNQADGIRKAQTLSPG